MHHTSYIIHGTSYIIHHTSHIIRHTSYIIHHTSYIIHHTSYIIHHTSYIIHHIGDSDSQGLATTESCISILDECGEGNPNPNPHPNPNPYACFLRDNQKEFRQAGRCVGTAQYSCTTYPKHVLNVYIQKSTSEIWPKITLSEAIHLKPTLSHTVRL